MRILVLRLPIYFLCGWVASLIVGNTGVGTCTVPDDEGSRISGLYLPVTGAFVVFAGCVACCC